MSVLCPGLQSWTWDSRWRSHQTGAEGQNSVPRPAGHTCFDAAEDTVGFLGCEHTLMAHVQLFIHQYPQVLLSRPALNPFLPQPVLMPGVTLTLMQDLGLGLVEPHEADTGPLLKLVQVPVDGILSLKCGSLVSSANCKYFAHVLCVDLRFVFRLVESVSLGSGLKSVIFIHSLASVGLIIQLLLFLDVFWHRLG